MSFAEAYEIAMQKALMRRIHGKLITAMSESTSTPCYYFAVDGEVFYFRYNGYELSKGKLTGNAAKRLLNNGGIYIVR